MRNFAHVYGAGVRIFAYIGYAPFVRHPAKNQRLPPLGVCNTGLVAGLGTGRMGMGRAGPPSGPRRAVQTGGCLGCTPCFGASCGNGKVPGTGTGDGHRSGCDRNLADRVEVTGRQAEYAAGSAIGPHPNLGHLCRLGQRHDAGRQQLSHPEVAKIGKIKFHFRTRRL